MKKNPDLKSSSPSPEAISHHLKQLLDSPGFKATPQQIAILKYVVEQTLAGNSGNIKGYTVATEVIGRGSDFDQSIDPVVSIQAARLRRALERYYLTSGKNDPIRIDIPKGTFVPKFREQLLENQPKATQPVAAAPERVQLTWPTVMVRAPANLTADPVTDNLSMGLATELAHALSHYREIQVLEDRQQDSDLNPVQTNSDFVIDGNIRCDPADVKVVIRLGDAKGIQIWSGNFHGSLEAVKRISFQEKVAAEVAVCLAGDNAAIARHLGGKSRKKAAGKLTTYEAILRYWESNASLTPPSLERAMRALEQALVHEPEYGQTWSMLAALYADNYGLEIVDLATPLEKAAVYAQRGVHLDPSNRRARMILAYVRFMENKLPEARHEAETAYQQSPNSLLVLDALGWVMALSGEWERGVSWIKTAIKSNPYYRPWARQAMSFNWFRLGDYEQAYQETLHVMMPKLHWDSLLKASVCGHLGKIEEGQACVRALLAIKPDFAQRGRILIGRYVKDQGIFDRIIEGLGKLGLTIAL